MKKVILFALLAVIVQVASERRHHHGSHHYPNHAHSYPKFQFHQHNQNVNETENRNDFESSSQAQAGESVQEINSDYQSYPSTILKLHDHFKNPDVDDESKPKSYHHRQGHDDQSKNLLNPFQDTTNQNEAINQNTGNTEDNGPNLHDVIACLQLCPMTSEYNPVCGTDGITYTNAGRLLCSQYCGMDVKVEKFSPCSSETVIHCAAADSAGSLEPAKASISYHMPPEVQVCLDSCPYTPNEYGNFICYAPDGFNVVKARKCEVHCGFEQPFNMTDCTPVISENSTTAPTKDNLEKSIERSPPLAKETESRNQAVDCMSICFVTGDKKPVCGTNNITYWNKDLLECCKQCGIDVELRTPGPCPRPIVNTSKDNNDLKIVTKGISLPDNNQNYFASSEIQSYTEDTNNKGANENKPSDDDDSMRQENYISLNDLISKMFHNPNEENYSNKQNSSLGAQDQENNEKQQNASTSDDIELGSMIPNDVLTNIFQPKQHGDKKDLDNPDSNTDNNNLEPYIVQDLSQPTYEKQQKPSPVNNGLDFTIPEDVLKQIFGSDNK